MAPKPKVIKFVCQHCKKEEDRTGPSAKQKFCSRTCYTESNKGRSLSKNFEAFCVNCDITFKAIKVNTRFCPECASSDQISKLQRDFTKSICKCGEEFLGRREYCSKECLDNYSSKKRDFESFKCEYCNKGNRNYHQNKYCSLECSQLAQRERNLVDFTCEYCQNTTKVLRSFAKNRRHCNEVCAAAHQNGSQIKGSKVFICNRCNQDFLAIRDNAKYCITCRESWVEFKCTTCQKARFRQFKSIANNSSNSNSMYCNRTCYLIDPKRNVFGTFITSKGLKLDSSYELRLFNHLSKHSVEVKKFDRKNCFKFFVNGRNRIYGPDFYLPSVDLYIEVKGWDRNENQILMREKVKEADNKLSVIFLPELKRIESLVSRDEIESYLLNLSVLENSGTPSIESDVISAISKAFEGFAEFERGYCADDELHFDLFCKERLFAIDFRNCNSAINEGRDDYKNKLKKANSLGITLYQVWNDSWANKRNIVLSNIASRLHLTEKLSEILSTINTKGSQRAYARNLTIDNVSKLESIAFLNENHIQGSSSSSYYLGLKDDEGLLRALMTITKTDLDTYRIDRFATLGIISGGFSKLLSHVEKTFKPKRVYTFADQSVSQGNLYEKTGFQVEKILSPDYSYVVDNRRVHKFNYRLDRFRTDPNLKFVQGMTESQLAESNNLPRVYDSGKIRFAKSYSIIAKSALPLEE